MDLNTYMKNIAEGIDGQYIKYDTDHSIIIVPISGGRFQTVIGEMKHNKHYKKPIVHLSSKVCPAKQEYNYRELIEAASTFHSSRLIIKEEYLMVEAICHAENLAKEGIFKDTLMEVAQLADDYEKRLTGTDIH